MLDPGGDARVWGDSGLADAVERASGIVGLPMASASILLRENHFDHGPVIAAPQIVNQFTP